MKKSSTRISRRKFLPAITGLLLTPFIGLKAKNINDNVEYKTFIKKDGTTVRVKMSTLKKAKVIKKSISNKSLLKWLGKK